MARVTAIRLRDEARAAMLAAGGRGFMRFLPVGGGLLATDANRRCADEAANVRLTDALQSAGFGCAERGGLLEITPTDGILTGITWAGMSEVDWESPLHPAQALAQRFWAAHPLPLTEAGRKLVLETLRLTWQPQDRVMAGLADLRAQAAVMLRTGDRSGMHEAGAILAEYCKQERQTGAGRKTE